MALTVRVAGINMPGEKRLIVAMTRIYGIGEPTARKVAAACNVGDNPKVKDLTEDQIEAIRSFVDANLTVEGDSRLVVSRNIKRLKEIGSYRGTRHSLNLPLRGQRTKTNARTKRGKRVTVGSGRHKSPDKT